MILKNRNVLSELQRDIIKLRNENPKMSINEIARILKCSRSHAQNVIKNYCETMDELKEADDAEGEILIHSVNQQRTIQKLRDLQRIERKIRKSYRQDNALEELGKEIVQIFKNRKPYNLKFHDYKNRNQYSGVFHLSDLHFNELINITSNKYDFSIASSRLKKMVLESIKIFKAYEIKDVLIAFTGDIMNSDRRLDELLNQATNRTKACSLSAIILEQMILELNHYFNITVACVSGNEGRVKEETGSTEIMLSDNYDFMINEMLKLMFRKNREIKFVDGYSGELLVDFNNRNILLVHGHQIKANHMTSIQAMRGKYSDMGEKIDFVLYGHLHSTLISDFYARSSSMCGANAYSDNDLQFSSKASQNIHIIGKADIHSIKIDLQDISDIEEGYEIDKDLEFYNAKSSSKLSWILPKKI